MRIPLPLSGDSMMDKCLLMLFVGAACFLSGMGADHAIREQCVLMNHHARALMECNFTLPCPEAERDDPPDAPDGG